jgi:hypothetical protein
MKHIWIKVSLILALSCSQEPTEEKQPEPVILTSSESICHCYDGAVSIYEALFMEEKLEYKKAYWKLRQECLTKYGILLLYDSVQVGIPSLLSLPTYEINPPTPIKRQVQQIRTHRMY